MSCPEPSPRHNTGETTTVKSPSPPNPALARLRLWAMRTALAPLVRRSLAALSLAAVAAAAPAATLTIACGSSGSELEFCKRHADAWARQHGHSVRTFSPPNNGTEALALYRQLFAAKSADIDVLLIDVVWPGIIKDHLLDLKPYSQGVEREHFPALIANNTVAGRLLGIPWYTDTGLLYYRTDLLQKYGLKPPDTWADLTAAAARVQAGERAAGHADFFGFVFQAKAYEGLSCNALEWIASHGGGSLIDAAGNITVNNPAAARALNLAASWVGTISPVGVLNYGEEDARGVFQNGRALFMRNWPYAWAPAQAADSLIKGKVGVVALPSGVADGGGAVAGVGPVSHAGTLGGWQLAVSRYSREPAAAASLVLHMTSAAVQKDRAVNGAFNPSRPALYLDPEIIAANPFMASLAGILGTAVARPSGLAGIKYPAVSLAFWDATHDVLSKKTTGEAAVRKLEGKLKLVRREQW